MDELRAALASGAIPVNAPVWRTGWEAWKAAQDVPELTTSALAAYNSVVLNVPPPPLHVVASQRAFEAASEKHASAAPFTGVAPAEPPPPPPYIPTLPRVSVVPASGRTSSLPRTSIVGPATSGRPSATTVVPGSTPSPSSLISVASLSSIGGSSSATSGAVISPSEARLSSTTSSAPPPMIFDGDSSRRSSAPPPPPPPRVSSRPPPPAGGEHPKTLLFSSRPKMMAAAAVADFGAEDAEAEELSDSMLLSDPLDPPSVSRSPRRPPSSVPPRPPSSAPPPPRPTSSSSSSSSSLRAGGGKGARPPSAAPPPPPAAPRSGAVAFVSPFASTDAFPAASPAAAVPDTLPARSADESEGGRHPESVPVASLWPRPDAEPEEETAQVTLPPLREAMPTPGRPHTATDASAGAVPPRAEEAPSSPLLDSRGPLSSELDPSLLLPRPWEGKPWLLPAGVAAVAVLVVLAGVGLFAKRSSSASTPANAATTVHPSVPAGAKAGPPSETRPAPAPTPTPTPCGLAGEPRVIAHHALVQAGVELAPLAAGGNHFAVGFATGPHAGLALALEPGTLRVVDRARAKGDGPRRITPVATGEPGAHLAAVLDGEGARGLKGKRVVDPADPFEVGVADGSLAWSPLGKGEENKLWPLDGDELVEAPRVASLSIDAARRGYGVVYRRAGSLWFGRFGGEPGSLVADGKPVALAGAATAAPSSPSSQVGSPVIAASAAGAAAPTGGGDALVAWAERASEEAPWGLRWARWTARGGVEPAHAFLLPEGGPGGQAMSPSLAAIPSGGYLFSWTEGAGSSHQVRAVTLKADGAVVGAPISLSAGGMNAGQSQIGVGSDGRGVAVALAAADKGFDVVATPVVCSTGPM